MKLKRIDTRQALDGLNESQRFQKLSGLLKEEDDKEKKINESQRNGEILGIIGDLKNIYEKTLNLNIEGVSENLKKETIEILEKVEKELKSKVSKTESESKTEE